MLPSHGAQNLSIPNHYFAFLRQVMEKMAQKDKSVSLTLLSGEEMGGPNFIPVLYSYAAHAICHSVTGD